MAEQGFITFEICQPHSTSVTPIRGRQTWRHRAAVVYGSPEDLQLWADQYNTIIHIPDYRFDLVGKIGDELPGSVKHRLVYRKADMRTAASMSVGTRAYALRRLREEALAKGCVDYTHLLEVERGVMLPVESNLSVGLGYFTAFIRDQESDERRLATFFGPVEQLVKVAMLSYSELLVWLATPKHARTDTSSVEVEQFACSDYASDQLLDRVEGDILQAMQLRGCEHSRICQDFHRFAALFGDRIPRPSRRRRLKKPIEPEVIEQDFMEAGDRAIATQKTLRGRQSLWFLRGAPTIDVYLTEQKIGAYR